MSNPAEIDDEAFVAKRLAGCMSFAENSPARDARFQEALQDALTKRAVERTAFPLGSPDRDEQILAAIHSELKSRHRASRRTSLSQRMRRKARIGRTGMGWSMPMLAGAALMLACVTLVWTLNGKPLSERTLSRRSSFGDPPQQAAGSSSAIPSAAPHELEASATPDESLATRLAAAGQDRRRLTALLASVLRAGSDQADIEQVAKALLLIDPDHHQARFALGHVREDGRWMTATDHLRWMAQRAAARVPTLEEQLLVQLERARGDVDQLWALHDWCIELKLLADAQRIACEVLALDTEHEGAHRSLGHVKVDGRWLNQAELEQIAAQERDPVEASTTALHHPQPPTSLALLGDAPLYAASQTVEVWVQEPALKQQREVLQRALARLSTSIASATTAFLSRHGHMTPERLRVGIYTRDETYRAVGLACEPLALEGLGVVVERGHIALHFAALYRESALYRAPESFECNEPLFYDQFLATAFQGWQRAEERVLWRGGLKAQRILGEPIDVAITNNVLVALPHSAISAKLALGAVRMVEQLERMMHDEGIVERHLVRKPTTLVLCDSESRFKNVRSILSGPEWNAAWHGLLDTQEHIWVADSYSIDVTLHGMALLRLTQQMRRSLTDDDLFWFHTGLAHLLTGQLLAGDQALHPRWIHWLPERAAPGGKLLPMRQLARVERGRLPAGWESQIDLMHAQSWALWHYWWYANGATARSRLLKALRASAQHPLNHDRFRQIFGDPDYNRMDEAIRRHVLSLDRR